MNNSNAPLWARILEIPGAVEAPTGIATTSPEAGDVSVELFASTVALYDVPLVRPANTQ
jgi:hypothetical protein